MLGGAGLVGLAGTARAFTLQSCGSTASATGCQQIQLHRQLLADLKRELDKRHLSPEQEQAVLAKAICPLSAARRSSAEGRTTVSGDVFFGSGVLLTPSRVIRSMQRPRYAGARWLRTIAAVIAGLLTSVPPAAQAHPHVFIKQHVAALFDQSGFTGFRLTWRFDPMYSSMMRADFVTSKTSHLTPADVKNLHDKSFIHLKEVHYFTTVTFNGEPLPLGQPTDSRRHRLGRALSIPSSFR